MYHIFWYTPFIPQLSQYLLFQREKWVQDQLLRIIKHVALKILFEKMLKLLFRPPK